jgi:hypothetical protein
MYVLPPPNTWELRRYLGALRLGRRNSLLGPTLVYYLRQVPIWWHFMAIQGMQMISTILLLLSVLLRPNTFDTEI